MTKGELMFEIGSMPPDGYLAWHEWADVQTQGGLNQSQCDECGLWFFPQESINHAPNKACGRRVQRQGSKSTATKARNEC